MNPLWILLIGMAVVVGGVLALRLHAFLALLAGAIVVALLTPASFAYRFGLRTGAREVLSYDAPTRLVTLKRTKTDLLEGTPLQIFRLTNRGAKHVASVRVAGPAPEKGRLLATVVGDGEPYAA